MIKTIIFFFIFCFYRDKISTIMDGIEKAIKEIQNKVAELSQPQKKN